MKRVINKMPCYNLFIKYSNPLFIEFYLKKNHRVLTKNCKMIQRSMQHNVKQTPLTYDFDVISTSG